MTAVQAPSRDVRFPGGCARLASFLGEQQPAALFDPANPALSAQPVKVGGRQSAWFVSGRVGSAVLRRYRRGGLMARLVRDFYLWLGGGRTRSFAEFDTLAYLRGCGLKVPAPIGAAYWRKGLLYQAAILVERIAGVTTLGQTQEDASQEAVAGAIFAMHEAGVWHADLNAHNILIDGAGSVWLIDFDKAQRRVLTAGRRKSNLLRLRRSLVKVAGERGLKYWHGLNQAYGRRMLGRNQPF